MATRQAGAGFADVPDCAGISIGAWCGQGVVLAAVLGIAEVRRAWIIIVAYQNLAGDTRASRTRIVDRANRAVGVASLAVCDGHIATFPCIFGALVGAAGAVGAAVATHHGPGVDLALPVGAALVAVQGAIAQVAVFSGGAVSISRAITGISPRLAHAQQALVAHGARIAVLAGGAVILINTAYFRVAGICGARVEVVAQVRGLQDARAAATAADVVAGTAVQVVAGQGVGQVAAARGGHATICRA